MPEKMTLVITKKIQLFLPRFRTNLLKTTGQMAFEARIKMIKIIFLLKYAHVTRFRRKIFLQIFNKRKAALWLIK